MVPAAWARDAISPHARVEPDPKCGTQYGYFWWLDAGCRFTPPQPAAAAIGNGGQRIVLVPGRDIVVVMTAGLYNSRAQRQTADAVLPVVVEALR